MVRGRWARRRRTDSVGSILFVDPTDRLTRDYHGGAKRLNTEGKGDNDK